jgi:hydroxyacylglutathione hydrolase
MHTEHRRLLILPLFGVMMGWAYVSARSAERAVSVPSPVLTEEGQLVLFRKDIYQRRELTKKLPLEKPWPEGPELAKALARFGLDRNTPAAVRFPAQVFTDTYLLGHDDLRNITYMLDCGREGVAIIDPGFESGFDAIIANVEKCGRSRKDIRWVLNTHCHVDHAMADWKFREAGAEIIVHEADAAAVEKGTRVTGYYLAAQQTGKPYFPRSRVDHRLSDGEQLQLGNKTLEVIYTPGHTPGSVCFLLRANGANVLLAGDTVFYDGRMPWQANPYADNRQYLASLEKLDRFTLDSKPVRWDVLLPGHGAVALSKACLDIQKARDIVAADLAAGREIPGLPFGTPEYRRQMFGRPLLNAGR